MSTNTDVTTSDHYECVTKKWEEKNTVTNFCRTLYTKHKDSQRAYAVTVSRVVCPPVHIDRIIQLLLTPKQFSTPAVAMTMSYVPSHESICTKFLQSEHCSRSVHWELLCDKSE